MNFIPACSYEAIFKHLTQRGNIASFKVQARFLSRQKETILCLAQAAVLIVLQSTSLIDSGLLEDPLYAVSGQWYAQELNTAVTNVERKLSYCFDPAYPPFHPLTGYQNGTQLSLV